MPQLFICPHCQAKTIVDDAFRGQSGECFQCGGRITIPSDEQRVFGMRLESKRARAYAQRTPRENLTRALGAGLLQGGLAGFCLGFLYLGIPNLLFNLQTFPLRQALLDNFLFTIGGTILLIAGGAALYGLLLFGLIGLLAFRHWGVYWYARRAASTMMIIGVGLGTVACAATLIIRTPMFPLGWFLFIEPLTWSALAGGAIGGILGAVFGGAAAWWRLRRLCRMRQDNVHQAAASAAAGEGS